MSLTLGVLASVLALLPGLTIVAAFNFRTRRGGARRPELPLTATSALVIAMFMSLLIHLFTLGIDELALSFVLAVHQLTGIDYGPVVANPIAVGFDARDGKPVAARDAVVLGATLLAKVIAHAGFAGGSAYADGEQRHRRGVISLSFDTKTCPVTPERNAIWHDPVTALLTDEAAFSHVLARSSPASRPDSDG